MSLKKAVISTVAAAAIASSAFAVEVTYNQKGNYVVMPAYYALENGNWTTNLRVTNTNTTHAVVAKVVVRSYENSEELIDFPIYLSPGDVWTADLVAEGGDVHIKSTDDSMIIGTPKAVVSDTNPVDVALHDNCSGANCKNYGYVEVFAMGDGDMLGIQPGWTEGTPGDKMKIFHSFFSGADYHTGGRDDNWTDPMDNIYAQTVVTSDGAGAEKSMSLMSTAFYNWDTTLPRSEKSYDQLIGTDSTFTNIYVSPDDVTAAGELEAALEKDNVYVTYYNNNAGETQLVLTQPVKHYDDNNSGAIYYDGSNTTYVKATTRDLSENTFHRETNDTDFSGGQPGETSTYTPCPTEQCYLYTSDQNLEDYETGYVDFRMLGNDSKGMDPMETNWTLPAIPTVVSGVTVGAQPIVNLYKPAFKETLH